MNVKRIDLKSHIISISITAPQKPSVRDEYIENLGLNMYHPKKGNPVIEDLMDKVVTRRRIPLDDGIVTLKAIKNKYPYLTQYVDDCIRVLNSYKNMI